MTIEEFRRKKQNILNSSSAKSGTTEMTIEEFRAKKEKMLSGKTEEPKKETQYNFTPEDAKLAKDMINTRVAMSTARALPTLIEQKKAEKAEQERWDNLSVPEKIVDPFKTMGANIKYGDLGLEESQAWTEYRNKQDEESLAKAQAATKAREEYEESNDRIGKGNAFTKDFAQYLPQLGGQLASGLGGAAGGAAAGAAGGAGVALAAGQLGPQVIVPEEIATVPAGALTGAIWGGRGGYVAGTAKYSYDLMAGSAYKTLLDMGVPNEVALELSGDEALINSLIEGAGSIVDLISLGLGKLGTKGATTATKKIAQNRLLAAAKAYGMNLVSEPLEEGAQQLVSIGTQKEAAEKAGIERNVTEAEDRQSVLDSMRSGLNVAAITGLGNVAGNVAVNSMSNNLNTNADTRKLPTIDSKTLNQLTEISKNIEEQKKVSETAQSEKNVARELPTMASQQAILSTNRIEGQTAQTGNMEQIAENEQFSREVEDALNNNESKGNIVIGKTNNFVVNKIKQILGIDVANRNHILSKDYIRHMKKHMNENSDNQISITVEDIKKVPDIINNPDDIIRGSDTLAADRKTKIPSIRYIKSDNAGKMYVVEAVPNKGNLQIKTMWKEPTELIHDTNALHHTPEAVNSNLSTTNNSIPEIDENINSVEDEQLTSMPKNYIDPSQDIQKATEFISKSTVEDIDTLNKMVEEAEKYPDRIDLQYFAEKAKKRIEYLTKSQRYLVNKVENLADKLNKQYGLNKEEVKKEIRKYANSYKNEDGKFTKDNLLNNLNAENILPKSELNNISNEIDNLNSEIDTVKRYEIEKAKNEETANQSKQYSRINTKAVSELYALKKQYQENSDRAMQNILLTKSDSIQLDRLLKGEITFDELPKNVNVEQIRKAYDAKKPLVDVNKDIQMYNKAKKQKRFDAMKELTKNSAQWKDKKVGFWYARETQERNIADIAPEEDATRIKKEIFEPIHHNEAEATRYKNALRDKIQDLKIDLNPKYEVTYNDSQGTKTEKVSESGLIQLYGEKKINDKTLEKLNVDIKKIKTAVETFRQIYNDIYNKTNEVLIENGYAPVEFRKDYFPHFEETKPDTLIGKALNKLGFKVDTRELPTDIAGITHEFKPGKKWVSNFLRRTTDVATYDAVKGFDSYIDSVADVIYHTDDIQKLRAYENALRYQHSDKVIKEQVDEITNMDAASEMKQSMIDQLYANAENSLSHYVTDLRAYTDTLAGKKSLEDRTMEHNLGRGIYNITKNVQNRVSANMVGANISSALTNFIPITQATGVIDGKYLLQSTWDMIKNSIKSDGFIEKSDFLTNRRGSDKLYKTKTDKLASATNLMSVFDNITSEIINRGRYYQNVANGMTEAEALNEANEMSGKILGDRSKGAVPTIFNQSSPMTKLLTAFQLEVNNQYSYFLKDIPNDKKDEVIGALVWAFAKVFIGAWVYNEIAEWAIGRRPATDPINIITETIGDITEGKKASEVALNLGTEIVEEIPFVGGLIGGGRLPISSALPDIPETVKATLSLFEEGDKKKATQTLISELSKPVFYIVPPFGGGQLKKTVEGLYTYSQGGNYGITSKGEKTLKYPVEQNVGNAIKSALFGKWATPGAQDYIDRGFKPLSANQTEAYEKAMKAGISSDDFFKTYDATRGIEGDKDKNGKTIENSKSEKLKEAIDKATPKLTSKQRKILYDAFDVSKTVQGGSGLPTQSELRANLPKVEIKIEK